jgi:hypothetical protein
MRARLVVGVVAIALPAFGIGVACTFPSPTFIADDGGSSGTSGSSGSSGSSGQPGDSGDVDPTGKDQDATTVPDGGGRIEAGADGGCGGNGCDCDNDKVLNQGCAAEGGPIDCDDFNPYIHQGSGFVSSPWDTKSPHFPVGDWDCSNDTVKQYAHSLGSCSSLSLGSCTAEGFLDDPPCGGESDYVTCGGTVACSEKSREKRTQGCK